MTDLIFMKFLLEPYAVRERQTPRAFGLFPGGSGLPHVVNCSGRRAARPVRRAFHDLWQVRRRKSGRDAVLRGLRSAIGDDRFTGSRYGGGWGFLLLEA